MEITFVQSENLERAAQITFANMQVYYAQFAPEWDESKVLDATTDLLNLDICDQREVVGVMRLQFEQEHCVLRDLQVVPSAQNMGIGALAIAEAQRRTLSANLTTLSLRVFKISPAVKLYQRAGFVVQSEDEHFLNMAKECRK